MTFSLAATDQFSAKPAYIHLTGGACPIRELPAALEYESGAKPG